MNAVNDFAARLIGAVTVAASTAGHGAASGSAALRCVSTMFV